MAQDMGRGALLGMHEQKISLATQLFVKMKEIIKPPSISS